MQSTLSPTIRLPLTDDASPRESCDFSIGASARELDRQPFWERARLDRGALRKLLLWTLGYIVLAAAAIWLTSGDRAPTDSWHATVAFVPVVVLLAFVFESLDAAAGMGFGTALAPLLLALGYDPLAVAPVLLLSEAVTGFISAAMHHEFRNVRFTVHGRVTEATKLSLVIAATGIAAIVASVVLTYAAFDLPKSVIKGYVTALVLLMAVAAIVRRFGNRSSEYRPKRMIGFAVWAAFNKGIGGGGYGPVITLGQIYSGVYEKSAAAITSLAEALVSLAGLAAFFAIQAAGAELNFHLVPSVLAGSMLAAVIAPYLVRVLPNKALGYVIPGYALALTAISLLT